MIARSGMDGSQPQPFVTKDIHWPNGVHVDYIGKRIYWVDAKMQRIESVKLDASDRRVSLYLLLTYMYLPIFIWLKSGFWVWKKISKYQKPFIFNS